MPQETEKKERLGSLVLTGRSFTPLEYYAQNLCFRQASNRDAVRTKTEISIELGKGRVPVSCHVEVPQKESVQQRVLRMGDSQEGNTERARKDVIRPEFQIEGEAERRARLSVWHPRMVEEGKTSQVYV